MDTQKVVRPFITTGEIVKLAMWRSTGKIKPKDKIGSSFLYDRIEVIKFLNSRQVKKKKVQSGQK